MNADEKAVYWQKKAEDNENKAERYRQGESLKGETSKMFSDGKIPVELMSVFNFDTATAEEIKATATLLGGYEFYPKGEFDKAVMVAVADKLKQTPPENHGNPPATTKQQYTAMTIDERTKLKQENPTLYHNLKGE